MTTQTDAEQELAREVDRLLAELWEDAERWGREERERYEQAERDWEERRAKLKGHTPPARTPSEVVRACGLIPRDVPVTPCGLPDALRSDPRLIYTKLRLGGMDSGTSDRSGKLFRTAKELVEVAADRSYPLTREEIAGVLKA